MTTVTHDKDDTTAVIQGVELTELPKDLYVPPGALRVFLETFEGPLDLLLYLIQRQNLNILDIPIAEITRQYMQYIELMGDLHLDLAAEYLVMAAALTEIKSQLLLPVHEQDEEVETDPRARLIKQLQEYAIYKKAAQDLENYPQVGRDVFVINLDMVEVPREIILPQISWDEFLAAMQDVMIRADLFSSHQILREPLSVRERMTFILDSLKNNRCIDFTHLFTFKEGRAGVVVTTLAMLELTKESLIQIVQLQPFGTIQIISLT